MKRVALAIAAMTGVVGTCLAAQNAQTGKSRSGDLAFDVEVALSPRAASELARLKEGLVLNASYYGDPTAAAERHANEVGLIDLGRETLSLPASNGPAHVTGSTIDPGRLGWIKGAPMVNVNIYSARRSGPDNLVACDFIDGPVSAVAHSQTRLACGLITESFETSAFPK